ncbi:MAG: hypothetical protein KKA79_01385, partial [Nanoarchaeota archaeon]|nr:hypothetical protein [Nanoarchaeota archaeon]
MLLLYSDNYSRDVLNMENIFKDLEKLKSNYNELVKQKPLTYILLEIAPKTYPFLSNFIDEATGIYNNMFGSTDTKPPYLYFCNHDFAKGWFQPNPKSIEEKLIKYGVNPDKSSIIEEVEHDPTGKPSVFISPHNKSFETDLWVIIHELAHWADYTFLNLEEFLGEKKESEELIQEFMKLFRIELPGEIFSKQCTNRILDKIPDIGRAIKSY